MQCSAGSCNVSGHGVSFQAVEWSGVEERGMNWGGKPSAAQGTIISDKRYFQINLKSKPTCIFSIK